MKGKKKLLAALPTLTARELVLVARDIHRAADAAAIGGATAAQWNDYVDAENAVLQELEHRFPCVEVWSVYNREGANELLAVYRRIYAAKPKKRRIQ